MAGHSTMSLKNNGLRLALHDGDKPALNDPHPAEHRNLCQMQTCTWIAPGEHHDDASLSVR
jgi:hypothetical protein